jgi:membrane associated rhomboid family serine protease
MKTRILILTLLAALLLPVSACTHMNRTQQGVVSGGLLGAGAGAGISALTGGNAGVGAALGGALGGVVGGVYGYDQQRYTNDNRGYRGNGGHYNSGRDRRPPPPRSGHRR